MLQVVIPFFKFRVIKGLAGITGVIFCKVLTPKGCFVRTIFPYVADACKEALKEFNLNVEGVVALDVGVSTGGFTDCLLQAGARKVYALDVGYGQLVWKLREDKRVVVIERTNIRYYEGVDFDEQINLATIDASFISLKIILPAVLKFLGDEAQILALIKPQFEVAREEVGKGGVVQDSAIHDRVVQDISGFCQSLNLEVEGTCASPVLGPAGNREFFIMARKKD